MNAVDESVEFPFGMYSESEERANRLTHGCGFLVSLFGMVYLMAAVSERHDLVRLFACGLYSFSLSAVYAMSTLSHGSFGPERRALFRSLDQGFIYFLIAGSVTPLSVTYLPAIVCGLLLVTMWTIAVAGFIAKVVFVHRTESVSVWVYVVLGWLPILATPWFLEAVPGTALSWGLAGGLFYTIGTIFLIFDHKVPYSHAIWHLFVMTGSTLHFLMTLFYVAQSPV